ncbi:MAG: PAAR domain-containing protein [Pseudomonadota bacterium]
MASAARANDLTQHGSPLSPGSGSPNVKIGGMPAWRAGIDMHTCPIVEGTKPHVGGVVVGGSSRVLINQFPAARVGDEIVEPGASAPNSISTGYSKVQIGD